MTWLGRLFRAFGRKVICTCTNPERCPMFGERRGPIHIPANLSNDINPQAKAWIDSLPSATIAVRFACPPGEHQPINITTFAQRHSHYLCGVCSAVTICLHDPLTTRHIGNALDCQQCITEAEETAQ